MSIKPDDIDGAASGDKGMEPEATDGLPGDKVTDRVVRKTRGGSGMPAQKAQPRSQQREIDNVPPEAAPADEHPAATIAPAAGGRPGAANGLPPAALYVTERWAELNDPDAPWWARSQGIGIRLRLRELLDIAEARNEGATLEQPVSALRSEAHTVLLRESSFLERRHGETAAQLRLALDVAKSDPLPPHGLNYSTVESALKQLDTAALRDAIVDELCDRADAAASYSDLEALDELVELLDAELAYDGYSAEWRFAVASQTRIAVDSGSQLGTAIEASIANATKGWPQTIRFLVPVSKIQGADSGAVTKLLDAKDVQKRLSVWLDGGPVDSDFALEDYAFSFDIEEAADTDAAVARASEWLEQELALYGLQGGELRPAERWLAIDSSANTRLVSRPQPLKLAPQGIKRVEARLSGDPTRRTPSSGKAVHSVVVADALVQLAQARRGTAGPALSDIWTVVEAVFAGAATEPRHLAGQVMSELLEYIYPLSRLEWMAGRLQAAGLERNDDGSSDASWALEQFVTNPRDTFKVSQGSTDPLLYVRSHAFGQWSGDARRKTPSQRMDKELKAVSQRCARVAARAYLVRNFQVHRAQPYRATALAATLPVFAEMARVALGYVAQNDATADLPITTAKLSLIRIRQVAWDFKTARRFGGEPLREALGNDLRS